MARRRTEMNDYDEENGEDSEEETTAANADASNSFIGKVRSSVSSILPNSLSKWFSPSSNNNNNNNDSANGSYVARKRTRFERNSSSPFERIGERSTMTRRRNEVNNYAEDGGDGGGGGVGSDGGNGDGEGNDLDGLDDEEGADENNHNDSVQIDVAHSRRSSNLDSPLEAEQPPTKRSRTTLDGTMLSSRPLVASTPAVNPARVSGAVNNHYRHLNLYAGLNRKELGYNSNASSASTSSYGRQNVAPDIIDVIQIPMANTDNDKPNLRKNSHHSESEISSSRRFLNIPPTTKAPFGSTNSNSVLPLLKRQSLHSAKSNHGTTESKRSRDIPSYDHKNKPVVLDPALQLNEVLLEPRTYNGDLNQKFLNGATVFEDELEHHSGSDSEAEDDDTIGNLPTSASIHSTMQTGMISQRAGSSGLFNMSSGNSRSGSRTSSLGNGLNFDTHLEGPKSLFAGNNTRIGTHTINLNSSTLSLNSLSRRKFNSSIYGSSSALSDSKLLNTPSPFYKGNTTYGGAGAYSKYATSLESSSRLTPILMRPASSSSTRSSSCNSITAGAGVSTFNMDRNIGLSNASRSILNLIENYSTPLTEARNMATSLHQQSSTRTPQSNKSKRLNESDLHASRALRLQQVRKPYMRPEVMLQSKKSNNEEQMPPVRELQVPSMSKLSRMREFQTITEESRKLAMKLSKTVEYPIQQPKSTVYTLPTPTSPEHKEPSVSDCSKSDSMQLKHVNKIKHKVANPIRVPHMPDETPPVPANLPNIPFPLMADMPKFDIELPITSKNNTNKPIETESIGAKRITTSQIGSDPKHIENDLKFSPPLNLEEMPSSILSIEPSAENFNFSKPGTLENTNSETTFMKTQIQSGEARSFLHTSPLAQPKSTLSTSVPTLKAGSVLDALKKPLVLPKSSSSNEIETGNATANPQPLNSFGNQFKKADNEWECDTCMIRNKESAQKCVACDVPRKGGSASTTKSLAMPFTSASTAVPLKAGFGDQFKKQTGEWECDTCMVRNKPEADKCVSCETARKTASKPIVQLDASKPFGQSIFGTSLNTKTKSAVEVTPDPGFKSLAATQKNSKWECEACMTRNEFSRSKCACCDHPKPGSENVNEGAPVFSFGATAASKFSFGFNAGAPDPAKQSVEKAAPSKGFTFGSENTAPTTSSGHFNFGFQPKPSMPSDKSSVTTGKDTSDSSVKTTDIVFGFHNQASTKTNPKTNVKDQTLATSTASTSSVAVTTTTPATTASFTLPKVTSFSFGTTPTTTSVLTLPTTKPQDGFGFGTGLQKSTSTVTSTVSSSATNKISFPILTTVESSVTKSSVSDSISTASPAFNFGVVSTSATSTTTAAKPVFSFGLSAVPSTPSVGNVSSSTTGVGDPATSSSSVSSGNVAFSFTNSTPSGLVATPAAGIKSPFGTKPSVNSNSPSNSNNFPAFGSLKSKPQASEGNSTTTTSSTFGAFTFGGATTSLAKTESSNLFGNLTPKTQTELKPIVSAVPIFSNATTQAESKLTTSNTWPKNTFLFGSPTTTTTATTKTNSVGNNETSVFGSLKAEESTKTSAANNNQNASTSIFGSAGVSSSVASFGNSTPASTAIFGTGSAVAQSNTANLFGSNNNTPASQFGAMSSGHTILGNNSSASNTPAFGNNNTSIGFGSFGTVAVTASATSTTNSEANIQLAVSPFAFGAPQTQTATSGFNFGATSATSRPAFNFTSTNQPTFNFTGSSTENTQNSTRPFQFGATTSSNFIVPPVFSFGSAPSTETSSNAPFQFNAGSAPPTSNIFAPAPSPSATTQATRRKVRIPARRLPPR